MMEAKEKERYLRQMNVAELGEKGQQKLKDTTFLVIGAGGLGSPAALLLAAAGAGKIILADFDTVEVNNLSRQFLHTDARVGMNKAESGAIALKEINPYLTRLSLTPSRSTMKRSSRSRPVRTLWSSAATTRRPAMRSTACAISCVSRLSLPAPSAARAR